MVTQTLRKQGNYEISTRLVAIAFQLFVEQGYENTTIHHISKAAGINPDEFTKFFSTKDALLYQLIENISCQQIQVLRAGMENLDATRRRLAKIYKFTTSLYEQYPDLLRFYMRYRFHNRTNGICIPNQMEKYLAEILQRGQNEGEIRDDIDPVWMVSCLNSLVEEQVCIWSENDTSLGLYELIMQGVDFFLIGALSTG